MRLSDEALKKILLENKLVESQEKINVLEQKAKTTGTSLYTYLVTNELVERQQLGEYIAYLYKVPYTNLEHYKVTPDLVDLVPEVVAKKEYAFVFKKDDNGIHLALNDPSNQIYVKNFEKRVDEKVVVYFSDEISFNSVFGMYYSQESSDEEERDFAAMLKSILSTQKEIDDVGDFPVIKIVDELIHYAYKNKASDVHVEPQEYDTVIRFRIDGILHDIAVLPREVHDLIVSRIKILARLRTDEHQTAQDGKLKAVFDKQRVDVRISIVPLVYGEKVVMRLLSERARQYDLENLGFAEADFEKISGHIKDPWGMILATGPTGCGKTTTLYSILKRLNKREINISTIEDPVEYDLEGVNQIQVNTKTNLTFAAGLRAIVRQDPDIIMVGEIRDRETAKIAINSAMTGHLVLSTLHTNDAPTTIPRLLDMDIEPFLVASTVSVVVAQRLVRKLCDHCKLQIDIDSNTLKLIQKQLSEDIIDTYGLDEPDKKIFKAVGCKKCKTGYKGRVGIFEVLEINEEIKKLIIEKATATQIKEKAIEHGMDTMIEDGIRKVLAGVTTIEEILRVAKE